MKNSSHESQQEMIDPINSAGMLSGDQAPSEELKAAPSVAELQAKIGALEDTLLRARAESQNIQRRAASERGEAIRFANAELMKSLIPVLEDFDRTLAAAKSSDATLLEGTRLVHANLMKALSDFGLESIEAAGEVFEPSMHEALMHQPTDQMPPGRVLEQVTRGYRLRDRVLRPARVIVSKAPE